MHAYRIVWEDEANAREIELFVDYTLDASVVQIEAIRPTKVTLYNAVTKAVERTMPVHTEAGRRLLTRSYLASREDQPSLEDEILAQHQLLDEERAAEVTR